MDNLLVVEKQEALHDQDVRVLLGVAHISCRCEMNAVGTGKLDRVLDPAFNGAGHGLHVQSCDHCSGENARQEKRRRFRTNAGEVQRMLKEMILIFPSKNTGRDYH